MKELRIPQRARATLVALLLLSVSAWGQVPFSKIYKPGTRLYVYTRSGLTLRMKPDIKSTAITLLPYGSELVVLPDTQAQVLFTNSNIKGAWVKVKHANKAGYMFDGFLSRLPAMSESNTERYLEDLTSYLKHQYAVLSETTELPEKDMMEYTKIIFENGVVYESEGYPVGASVSVSFPSSLITFKEVFLLARLVYPEFFTTPKCAYQEGEMDCDIDEGLTNLKIKKEGTNTAVVWGHAD